MVSVFSEVEDTTYYSHPLTSLNTMKKLIVLCSIFIALGFVVTTGCGGGSSKPTPPPTTPDATAAPEAASDAPAGDAKKEAAE